MAEYINLEKLIALKSNNEYMWYDLYDLEDFLADVKKECSVDVVEVVRCGQCKHATEDIIVEGVCYCHKIQQGMFVDGFCNYGERRNTK